MLISNLSILLRAAEHFASASIPDGYNDLITELYPGNHCPFRLDEKRPIPLHLFSPRLAKMLKEDRLEARTLWEFVSSRENIIRMITATELKKTAAEGLATRFLYHFSKLPHVSEINQFKQMVGYMIKVIMELFGYQVSQRRVQIVNDGLGNTTGKPPFFSTASRYSLFDSKDLIIVSQCIDNVNIRDEFLALVEMIRDSKTLYQQEYALDKLTNWRDLI
jgi:hypothetical protein